MSKLWCIALAFGDDEKSSLVSSTYIAPTSEMAVAMLVSQFYTDNPGVRMPLRMISTHELTREYLDKAIAAMDEAEAKPPSVVQLVPKPEQAACEHEFSDSIYEPDRQSKYRPADGIIRCIKCGAPRPAA